MNLIFQIIKWTEVKIIINDKWTSISNLNDLHVYFVKLTVKVRFGNTSGFSRFESFLRFMYTHIFFVFWAENCLRFSVRISWLRKVKILLLIVLKITCQAWLAFEIKLGLQGFYSIYGNTAHGYNLFRISTTDYSLRIFLKLC